MTHKYKNIFLLVKFKESDILFHVSDRRFDNLYSYSYVLLIANVKHYSMVFVTVEDPSIGMNGLARPEWYQGLTENRREAALRCVRRGGRGV